MGVGAGADPPASGRGIGAGPGIGIGPGAGPGIGDGMTTGADASIGLGAPCGPRGNSSRPQPGSDNPAATATSGANSLLGTPQLVSPGPRERQMIAWALASA
jgi:hypothetical protein